MTEPRWLRLDMVFAMHAELLAEHGGAEGLRDEGGLESALGRPRQKHHRESPDLVELAAASAYGLCSNHPFLDGNERIALTSASVFLRLNGWRLAASEVEAASVIRRLASSEMSEAQLVAWMRKNAEECDA